MSYVAGIEGEDIRYLKRCYEQMLQEDTVTESSALYWLNDVHWVDHAVTNIPDPAHLRKRRKTDESVSNKVHKTGEQIPIYPLCLHSS